MFLNITNDLARSEMALILYNWETTSSFSIFEVQLNPKSTIFFPENLYKWVFNCAVYIFIHHCGILVHII